MKELVAGSTVVQVVGISLQVLALHDVVIERLIMRLNFSLVTSSSREEFLSFVLLVLKLHVQILFRVLVNDHGVVRLAGLLGVHTKHVSLLGGLLLKKPFSVLGLASSLGLGRRGVVLLVFFLL